jgi:cyanate permease
MTRSTFAMPALLGAATVIGLVAALTGDGWRDALGWIGLAAPVAAIGWGWRRRT